MAQIFTGWSFDKALSKELDRKQQSEQFDELNKLRYQELGERIEARKATDEYRKKALATEIEFKNQQLAQQKEIALMNDQLKRDAINAGQIAAIETREDTQNFQDANREDTQDFQRELLDVGKTKEERASKSQARALASTIPTFDEYDQDEAVTEWKDFLGFDEGEFRREADKYIDSIQMNIDPLMKELKYNPDSPIANKHLDDLAEIYDVLDSGEYKGPLDSYLFNFFDGEATGAKKSKAKIARILNALGRQID